MKRNKITSVILNMEYSKTLRNPSYTLGVWVNSESRARFLHIEDRRRENYKTINIVSEKNEAQSLEDISKRKGAIQQVNYTVISSSPSPFPRLLLFQSLSCQRPQDVIHLPCWKFIPPSWCKYNNISDRNIFVVLLFVRRYWSNSSNLIKDLFNSGY